MAYQLLFTRTVVHQRAYPVVEDHQLVNTGTTAIAELMAFRASLGAVQYRPSLRVDAEQAALGLVGRARFLAMRAEYADQALSQHTE